jgi:hypothetical protein
MFPPVPPPIPPVGVLLTVFKDLILLSNLEALKLTFQLNFSFLTISAFNVNSTPLISKLPIFCGPKFEKLEPSAKGALNNKSSDFQIQNLKN